MNELPREIWYLILNQKFDFSTWYHVRFVCKFWYNIVIENQESTVWQYVCGGILPNGMYHGIYDGGLYKFGVRFGYTISSVDSGELLVHTIYNNTYDMMYCDDYMFNRHMIAYIDTRDYVILEFDLDGELLEIMLIYDDYSKIISINE